MGYARAAGMAEAVADGSVGLHQALIYHLTVNHYPPLPLQCVPVAYRLVESLNAGTALWSDEVDTDVVRHRTGRPLTVAELVDGWHLDPFLEPYAYEDDDCPVLAEDVPPTPYEVWLDEVLSASTDW